ncbi:MAG: dihydroxy-acid dehydratase [Bryobacterales bacterium]|nr:dihydroxy-acid dehydratase [Bryobacterales bacterium]
MNRGLRKNLTSYGDADFSLFLRSAFVKAMGYSDDALERPIVGISNTFSDYNPCHGNVPDLIEAVKRGVMLAGALPMVFPTMSLHESFAYPTAMYLRNLMAMETEELIRCQPMDSVVLIGGCDKTLPAQIMAAASVNIPAIVLPTGPMVVGHYKGEVLGACTDCRRMWSLFRAGQMAEAEVKQVNAKLAPSVGTCMVMGTASTMACITEALGLCLPMGATIPATHSERRRLAEGTGKRAAEMAMAGHPLPSDVLTDRSIQNASVVMQSIGGSTNGLIHLSAIARRVGHPIDLDEFDRAGRSVPVLVDLKPSGEHYMEHFHQAGGVPRLMKELADLLSTDVPTVAGGTLADSIASAENVPGQDVIRPRSKPLKANGALVVLRGNLAPRGSVIKQSAASVELLQHTGSAVVFDSVEQMMQLLDGPDLDVTPTSVLVLRNAGPKGAPGMPEAGYIPIPKKLARLGVKDMVRISDARMSGTAFGTVVLHIAPEAAAGGPLALVRSGDLIRLDVPARRLDLLVSEGELQARAREMGPRIHPDWDASRGYAKLFLDTVLQADEGCDFDFMVKRAADETPG